MAIEIAVGVAFQSRDIPWLLKQSPNKSQRRECYSNTCILPIIVTGAHSHPNISYTKPATAALAKRRCPHQHPSHHKTSLEYALMTRQTIPTLQEFPHPMARFKISRRKNKKQSLSIIVRQNNMYSTLKLQALRLTREGFVDHNTKDVIQGSKNHTDSITSITMM